MKKSIIFTMLAFSLIFSSCRKEVQDQSSQIVTQENQDLKAQARMNFTVHLSGDNEVPPNLSQATGEGIFQLRNNETELHYKLIVANIENVMMSHIHVAPAGSNGPVVAWLYPSAPPPVMIEGRFDGVLAEGVITSANLVGPLAGHPLSDLVDLLRSGGAYTNVHTMQYPGGEIRGQF